MAPKKNVKSKIDKNTKQKGKKKRTPKKLETPTKGVSRKVTKKKIVSKPKVKEAIVKAQVISEDKSYNNLSNVEPMFKKEIKEEIIEQVHDEIEMEEKNILLKIAKSVIISTFITALFFFVINMLITIVWEQSLPILIAIWIILTLLVYLFQTK
jgi:hypothetical protein